jgi:hypothetical protein
MKVKEVIEKLKTFNQDAEFIVSCDEELNTLYSGYDITELDNENNVVIFGLSGEELEDFVEL